VPLDEKVAVLEVVKNISLTVKDALSELEQIKQSDSNRENSEKTTEQSTTTNKTKTSERSDDDDDFDDLIDFDDICTLSPQEYEVIPGVKQLVKLSVLFITKIEAIISMSTPDDNESFYNTWMDDLRKHVVELATGVDELSSSTYSPQVRQDVEKNFEKVKQTILSTLPTVLKHSSSTKGNIKALLDLICHKITLAQLIILTN